MGKRNWGIISKRTWTDNWQSRDYEETLSFEGVKLRIRLHHDTSYSNQCWARIERWDGSKWQLVASLGRPKYVGNRYYTEFDEHRNQLLKEAEAIVF